ncbi:hypothetical protein ACS0TY_016235 [Phlomoides rotata]
MEATQLLPEEMIQHIQSFLDEKEAARTSILSRSWYDAWLTRPNLDFSDFTQWKCLPFLESAFVKSGRKTLQRYEELNLKIQSFKLSLDDSLEWKFDDWKYGELEDTISVAIEWTKKAINLGATHLKIEFLREGGWDVEFLLPREVLESEFLVGLSFYGGTIDAQDHKVSWSRLKSLCLDRVCIQGNTNIWGMISMCPLIEELVLSECNGTCDHNLTGLEYLKVLRLMRVKIGEWLLRDLSSKFPRLKKLTLEHCTGYDEEEIQICSNSLEFMSFLHEGRMKTMVLRFIFDFPRIKKLKLLTPNILPSLSFKTASPEWESHISMACKLESSSLMAAREFLQELSPSKIHLILYIPHCFVEMYDPARAIISLRNPHTVEELTIYMFQDSSIYSMALEDLFWSCRPNSIVLYIWSYDMYARSNSFAKFLCYVLIEDGNENRNISALYDLEEVNVEFFEDDPYAESSRSLSCKTLLDALAYSGDCRSRIKFCLQLRWG